MDRDQPDLALKDFEAALRLRPDFTNAFNGGASRAPGSSSPAWPTGSGATGPRHLKTAAYCFVVIDLFVP